MTLLFEFSRFINESWEYASPACFSVSWDQNKWNQKNKFLVKTERTVNTAEIKNFRKVKHQVICQIKMLLNFTVYNHSSFFKNFVTTGHWSTKVSTYLLSCKCTLTFVITLKKKLSPYLSVKLQFFATLHFLRCLKSVEVRGRKEG